MDSRESQKEVISTNKSAKEIPADYMRELVCDNHDRD